MRRDTRVIVSRILARLQRDLSLAVRIHEHDTAIRVFVVVVVRRCVAVALGVAQFLRVAGREGGSAVVSGAGGLLFSLSEDTARAMGFDLSVG